MTNEMYKDIMEALEKAGQNMLKITKELIDQDKRIKRLEKILR